VLVPVSVPAHRPTPCCTRTATLSYTTGSGRASNDMKVGNEGMERRSCNLVPAQGVAGVARTRKKLISETVVAYLGVGVGARSGASSRRSWSCQSVAEDVTKLDEIADDLVTVGSSYYYVMSPARRSVVSCCVESFLLFLSLGVPIHRRVARSLIGCSLQTPATA
jgi:hypothetical protein